MNDKFCFKNYVDVFFFLNQSKFHWSFVIIHLTYTNRRYTSEKNKVKQTSQPNMINRQLFELWILSSSIQPLATFFFFIFHKLLSNQLTILLFFSNVFLSAAFSLFFFNFELQILKRTILLLEKVSIFI